MKRTKRFIVMVFVAVVCFFGGLTSTIATVLAQDTLTYNTFVMQSGASARLKTLKDADGNDIETNGLRFAAEISEQEYTALKNAGARFGVVIVASDLVKGKIFNEETGKSEDIDINETTVFGTSPSFYFMDANNPDKTKIPMTHIESPACENIDTDANVEICGSIVNIKVNNFTRAFIGRAYVAIPHVNAETGATEYTYHFAPYFEKDVANNTRSIYYVAQRDVELGKDTADVMKEKYLIPFSETERFQNYKYRYYIEHHYVVHDENGEHKDALVYVTDNHFAELNSTVTAEPIVDPVVPGWEDHSFIFDVKASEQTRDGLVYANGMLRLKLYYELAETISEDHFKSTLDELLADFLDVEKAGLNFGLHVNGEGYDETWTASAVNDPDDPNKQIGIALTAEKNATKNRHLLLSKHFFDELRAFGVESVSFDFHGTGNKEQLTYMMYQEKDLEAELKVYDDVTGARLTGSYTSKRVRLYLKDITEGGGVLIELAPNSSSNKGVYHFGNITFNFPAHAL